MIQTNDFNRWPSKDFLKITHMLELRVLNAIIDNIIPPPTPLHNYYQCYI